MGSIVSKIADEIKLHGSYEAYLKFQEMQDSKVEHLPDKCDIPYFPDPEEVISNKYLPDPEEVITNKKFYLHIESMQGIREMFQAARSRKTV